MVETKEKGGYDNGRMSQASLLAMVPTIAGVMGISNAPEWEGSSMINQ